MPFNATRHYENFPVGSLLLPARLREPIGAVYAFARSADDLADEGDATAAERLAALHQFGAELDRIGAGQTPTVPLFVRVANAVRAWSLPLTLFHDLLDAFSQDVTQSRYADLPQLLDYSRRSANPIGRLLLHLFGQATPQHLIWSDSICSALQLINFWQDIAIDWAKGRVYLPQSDLAAFGVTEAHIAAAQVDARWQRLMAFEVDRTRAMLESGAPLGTALPGRFGLEIRTVLGGGARILRKIAAVNGDVFRYRPVLGRRDWISMLCTALLARPLSSR